MENLNFIVLEGELIRDPLYRETELGLPCCCFTVVNRSTDSNGTPETNFINIDTWSKVAEKCARFLRKGTVVRVRGRLNRTLLTDRDGTVHALTGIDARHVDIISKPADSRHAA